MYGVKGKLLQNQYKDFLSDYSNWNQISHAKDWLLYPQNIGENLSIDETALSYDELYTLLPIKKLNVKQEAL